MKSIFAHLFKKKDITAASETSQSSTVKHNFDSASEFLPRSHLPLYLVAVLLLVLGVFSYRYLSYEEEVESFPAPKGANQLNGTSNLTAESIGAARRQFENKEIDQSILSYKKLLDKAPRDPQILNDLGVLYLKKQAFNESEGLLKRSVDEAPDCVVCLNNLGYLKTLQGKNKEAETLLKKALAINGAYIDPYFNLGVLYEKNGDFASSASAYNEFLSRSKDANTPFNLKLKQHVNKLLEK